MDDDDLVAVVQVGESRVENSGTYRKGVGALVGLRGAMIFTFYGLQFNLSTNVDLPHSSQSTPGHVAQTDKESGQIVLGTLLAVGSWLLYALWLILQVK